MKRRDLIKTSGSVFGLSMANGLITQAQANSSDFHRIVIIPIQHGWGMRGQEDFSNGNDFNLPAQFSPLESLKNEVTLIDGLLGTWWGNAHDVSYTDILTGSVEPGWPNGPNTSFVDSHFAKPNGISIDTLIGEHFNSDVIRMSAKYRSWSVNAHPISFSKEAQWLEPEKNPLSAFESVFGSLNLDNLPANTKKAKQYKAEQIIHFLNNDLNKLKQKSPTELHVRLDAHMDAVQKLAVKLGVGGVDLSTCSVPSAPKKDYADSEYGQYIDAYYSVIENAFACGTHRVAVLGIGDHLKQWNWEDSIPGSRTGSLRVGATDKTIMAKHFVDTNNDKKADTLIDDNVFHDQGFHHDVAHYGKLEDEYSQVKRLAFEGFIRWHVEKVKAFAEKLNGTVEANGKTMLENTAIILTGEVSSGSHNTLNKGVLILGGSAFLKKGYIRQERVKSNEFQGYDLGWKRTYSTRTENDMWVGLAHSLGIDISTFGHNKRNIEALLLKKG